MNNLQYKKYLNYQKQEYEKILVSESVLKLMHLFNFQSQAFYF